MSRYNVPKSMSFSLERIEIPVTIGSDTYTLKEADGAVAKKYKNAKAKAVTMDKKGRITGLGDVAGSDSYLIHLCLFNSQGQNVPQSIIESWPNRIQKDLLETALRISGLDESYSIIRSQIEQAFTDENPPVDLETLRNWIEGLDEEKYDHLLDAFKPSTPETLKN